MRMTVASGSGVWSNLEDERAPRAFGKVVA
jgi:hypothetical protein